METPVVIGLNDAGILYSCNAYGKMFTLSEVKRLKNLIDKTYNYYLEHEINDDWANYVNKVNFEKLMERTPSTKKEVYKKDGFVYVMYDKHTKQYKIGFSKNPNHRERTLQSEKPSIDMIFSYKSNTKVERDLHEKYKDYRTRGEWFKINKKQIKEIENYLINGA